MKGITLVLIHCFLFHSLVFGSGWFGGILAGEIKLCECNHGSKKETHATVEDLSFKTKLATADSSPIHTNETNHPLPDCQSAEVGEAHKCSCAKAKDKVSLFTGTLVTQILALDTIGFFPNLEESNIVSFQTRTSGIDLSTDIERPPSFY
ncbi:hypothetical protein LEP1GSC050_2021 [Leptospira broomii serovar Hurstbridge str. 5399]|uniref:Uncharacterized protein n=1 Tax=Leptospira broomii serovar Hurstbridge str. 5399 TaxID=1049789 RepID=T0GGV3_9LEPT|nr:hypothetical protein [Leptospira broomii]EQA44623.1 hypothetical protein LEP1GSC050_2021 [Leptospira broomii serovar Hurstbridge str. 5399]